MHLKYIAITYTLLYFIWFFSFLILTVPSVSTLMCSSSVRVMPYICPHCSLATSSDPRRPHQCAWCCVIALLAFQQSQTFFPSAHSCDVPCLCSRLSYPRHWFLNQSAPKASLSMIKNTSLEEECLFWGAWTLVIPLPDHRECKGETRGENNVQVSPFSGV